MPPGSFALQIYINRIKILHLPTDITNHSMGRLSELNTGEKAVIVKILGHGGFRKRIIEMGFIQGKTEIGRAHV